jgi:large subunit ribosomal protein L21
MDFHDVLMVANGDDIRIGTPQVDGGKVTAKVLEQGRGKKVKILKFKRRKHHMKRMGHRQSYTEVKITGIMAEGIEATLPSPEIKAKNVETTPSETEVDTQNVEAAIVESVIDSQKVGVTLPSSEAETQKSEEVKPHGT